MKVVEKNMEDYRKMYLQLFNAVTDALEEIEKMDFGAAREILVRGQLTCEEVYLEEEN